jgi:S-adenosylmethionine/arginine decarboxylase-like enzyme
MSTPSSSDPLPPGEGPLVATVSFVVAGDFSDSPSVWHAFLTVVNQVPGLTVLNSCHHLFPGGGFSGLVLIGESHAAIHTWPEHGRAWVELATCGSVAALDGFEEEVGRVWERLDC